MITRDDCLTPTTDLAGRLLDIKRIYHQPVIARCTRARDNMRYAF